MDQGQTGGEVSGAPPQRFAPSLTLPRCAGEGTPPLLDKAQASLSRNAEEGWGGGLADFQSVTIRPSRTAVCPALTRRAGMMRTQSS